jgi:hypothetical protein
VVANGCRRSRPPTPDRSGSLTASRFQASAALRRLGTFRGDGEATAEIVATRDDRLADWRTLQELAGTRGLTSAEEGADTAP